MKKVAILVVKTSDGELRTCAAESLIPIEAMFEQARADSAFEDETIVKAGVLCNWRPGWVRFWRGSGAVASAAKPEPRPRKSK